MPHVERHKHKECVEPDCEHRASYDGIHTWLPNPPDQITPRASRPRERPSFLPLPACTSSGGPPTQPSASAPPKCPRCCSPARASSSQEQFCLHGAAGAECVSSFPQRRC